MSTTLNGIRVLDFGRYIAGPYCAALLADFGADVTRVERRGGGEDRAIAPVTAEGEGAIFLQMNRNKASLAIDLRHENARAVVERLIRDADVVVVNVPTPALAAMGLDYETLRTLREDIILVNVSSFGAAGPWASRGGFDSVGQAMCGSIFLTGEGEGESGARYRTPISWVDHASGLYAALGVMMALRERERTGRGQMVETSLLATAIAFASTYMVEEATACTKRAAIGNRSCLNGPTDLFRTRDGAIVTQVVGDALFRRWARLIGEPDLIDDPRFASDEARGRHGALLSARMQVWCGEVTTDDALDRLGAAGIPAGPVLSPAAAIAHPQVQAADMFRTVAYPGLDTGAMLLRAPIDMSASPPAVTAPPPRAGADNDAVLAAYGFSTDEIDALKARAVI